MAKEKDNLFREIDHLTQEEVEKVFAFIRGMKKKVPPRKKPEKYLQLPTYKLKGERFPPRSEIYGVKFEMVPGGQKSGPYL